MQGERIDKRVIYLYDSLRNRYEKKLEKPFEALVKSHAEAAKRLNISTSAELVAIDNRVEDLSKRRDPASLERKVVELSGQLVSMAPRSRQQRELLEKIWDNKPSPPPPPPALAVSPQCPGKSACRTCQSKPQPRRRRRRPAPRRSRPLPSRHSRHACPPRHSRTLQGVPHRPPHHRPHRGGPSSS